MKILIADDDSSATSDLRAMIARHGYDQVVEATSVEGALKVLGVDDAEEIEAVVIDWQMPNPDDGPRLIAAIRDDLDRSITPYLILISAFNYHAREAFAVRADDFLPKPVAPYMLVACLQNAARKARVARESRAEQASRGGLSEQWSGFDTTGLKDVLERVERIAPLNRSSGPVFDVSR